MAELASMRPQIYGDPRSKEHFDRFHERARSRDPDWAYEFTRLLTSAYAFTLLRTRAIAPENVPGKGAVILAPNHFSFMDHFIVGCYLRRKIRFMAKSQLFKPPMQFIYTHGGVFPVRRGSNDEETFITARTLLANGAAVLMYPEGGRSRSGEMGKTAKRGIGRLALETGAPVVPVAISGSSHVRNWKRLRFPEVTVQFGEALRWQQVAQPDAQQEKVVANEVLEAIRGMYDVLRADGRQGALEALRKARGAAPADRALATG